MIATLAFVGVLLSALFLLSLGLGAFVAPDHTRHFLGTFASTMRAHFLEMTLRMAAGASLVLRAPMMQLPELIALFGWVLISTTLVLAFVPWRLHRRFAAWSVPMATQRLSLLGLASLAGGALLLVALLDGIKQ